jgi:hypothetical protein
MCSQNGRDTFSPVGVFCWHRASTIISRAGQDELPEGTPRANRPRCGSRPGSTGPGRRGRCFSRSFFAAGWLAQWTAAPGSAVFRLGRRLGLLRPALPWQGIWQASKQAGWFGIPKPSAVRYRGEGTWLEISSESRIRHPLSTLRNGGWEVRSILDRGA